MGRKKVIVKCSNCSKEIEKFPQEIRNSKSGNVFCNQSCAASYNNEHYRKGENNPNFLGGQFRGNKYGKYAFRAFPHKCHICELDEKCCLEVHHINQNRKDDSLSNLMILCANCHRKVHAKIIDISSYS